MRKQDKKRLALSIGTCLTLLFAFIPPLHAVVGAVRVAAVQDSQQVPQVTITILQNEEVVAEEETDKSGVAYFPLEEGDYTMVTEHDGTTIREDITVEAGVMASFIADVGRGVLQVNPDPLNRYNPAQAVSAEEGYSLQTADFDGLLSMRFETPDGLIYLGFPYQAQAGETVSMRAILVPGGAPDDREETTERLTEHAFRINDQTFSLQESLTWTTQLQARVTVALLENEGGDVMLEYHISLDVRTTVQYTTPSDNIYFATAGWPVRINGTFDGRADNTEITFGGVPVDPLAETSVAVFFNPPSEPIGLQSVSITDNGTTQDCMVRSAGLELWADKLDLLKGESTQLHLRISGLAGLPGIVFVALFNNSTTVVSMGQGNYQFFILDPKEVDPSGIVTYNRSLTGIRRGLFNILAILTQP